MSESRGLTLRKKRKDRPVISGPTLPSGPASTRPPVQKPDKSDSSLAIPRERNAPTETSDLVKRRYSTRYNQLPDFSNLDNPPVPSLPAALKRRSGAASPRRPGTAASSHPLHVDQNALNDPNLQHERYVADLLSTASEQDIQDYQNSLRRIKKRTSLDLQQSVYQNRTQFIKISKEAERLKDEMQMLKQLMTELTGALSQTGTSSLNDPLSPAIDGSIKSKRNANRTSVANLENMWNIQLQTLWKTVEKSQKFLPAVPGRHIIMETGNWIELDSATWKPKRPVHIVILNDHFLVASKKRKRVDPNVPQQGPVPIKRIAEECWPLQDIDLVDMSANIAPGTLVQSEERAITTAITVRSGARSLTYRHEKRDEKAKTELVMSFRKTVEDLRKANKADKEKTSPQTESLNYFATRDPALAKTPGIIESINAGKEKPDILIEVDGKQQNFRWVEGQIDDLDMDIALQRFEESVEKVETLRKLARGLKSNTIAQEIILLKLDERASNVANAICRRLVDHSSFMESTKKTTSYLMRLGFEDRARKTMLAARSDALTKRARQCVFEGDLHRYVFSISFVYFTMIKNTVLIYQACFASTTTSACIKWAYDQLETFNTLLVRQLSSVEKGGKVWRECMDVVWAHEKEMLAEVGLDFREVIGRHLEISDVASTPKPQVRHMESGIREQSRSKSRARGTVQ